MPRKRRGAEENNGYNFAWNFGVFASAIFVPLYYIYKKQIAYFFSNYWMYVAAILFLIICIFLVILIRIRKRDEAHRTELRQQISSNRQLFSDFINKRGRAGRQTDSWKYRGYAFDKVELKDFSDFLREKHGVALPKDLDFQSMSNENEKSNDLLIELKRIIDTEHKGNLINSLEGNSKHNFESLNGEGDKAGDEFERLVMRLYEAMGYTCEHKGGSGDQGADVVAWKNGEGTAIQAKCWNKPLGNGPVQEVIAALKIHGCTKAAVVTNSSFTPGAVEAAQKNGVELIDGALLRHMLLEHLGQAWS